MERDPRYLYRKSTRISKYDYSSRNYYFVTVCTHEKNCIFGMGERLTALGKIAESDFLALKDFYDGVRIDAFVVMPNHIHAIVAIDGENGMTGKTTLSSIVGSYKSGVSRKIHMIDPDIQVWQRSFHDHIIRNRQDYEKIWDYITFNAQKWEADCFYTK